MAGYRKIGYSRSVGIRRPKAYTKRRTYKPRLQRRGPVRRPTYRKKRVIKRRRPRAYSRRR